MVLGLAFACAVALTILFLVKLVLSTWMWGAPHLPEQALAGWMTPRYVAHAWQVAPEVVAGALGIEMDGSGRRVTLDEIAALQGRSLDAVIEMLDAALATAPGDRR